MKIQAKKPLVEWYIRNVSIGVIQIHLESFREFVGPRATGIYVLRKGRDIYYVGRVSRLRFRLAAHLKDHRRRKWDRFDLYALRRNKVKYLCELETLLIRVGTPTANKVKKPKFAKQWNRTKEFKRAVVNDVIGLFLGGKSAVSSTK